MLLPNSKLCRNPVFLLSLDLTVLMDKGEVVPGTAPRELVGIVKASARSKDVILTPPQFTLSHNLSVHHC